MGVSGSKTKSTSKPVYGSQIEGAASNISNAYSAQAPKITGITDNLSTLVPGLIEKYTQGDPNVTAASGYNADVLSGKYLNSNPYLEGIVQQAGNDARNQTAAALGPRGLTGGSSFADIISRNVANASQTLRYNDFNTQLSRMDQAAAQAPSLSAAQYQALAPVFDILNAQSAPVQAASGAGAGIGGLLGQYTNTTQKSSPSLGAIIAQMAGNAASGWAAGGFKGV